MKLLMCLVCIAMALTNLDGVQAGHGGHIFSFVFCLLCAVGCFVVPFIMDSLMPDADVGGGGTSYVYGWREMPKDE